MKEVSSEVSTVELEKTSIRRLIQKIEKSQINIDCADYVDAVAGSSERGIFINFYRCTDFNKFVWICFSVLESSAASLFEIESNFCHVASDFIIGFDDYDDTPANALNDSIIVLFPSSLLSKIQAAFDKYLSFSGLKSSYDESASLENLQQLFLKLKQFYFSDVHLKMDDHNLDYEERLLKSCCWYPIQIELGINDGKVFASIKEFEKKFSELCDKKRSFDEGEVGKENSASGSHSPTFFSGSETAGKRSRSPSPARLVSHPSDLSSSPAKLSKFDLRK